MDRLLALQSFVRVVDTRSFSHAAVSVGTTQPVISKRIAQLERTIGARLLLRGPRLVLPTDDGRILYERARQLLDAAAELFDGIGARRAGRFAGLVSLAAPPTFAARQLLPRLPPLMALFPGLQVELRRDDEASAAVTTADIVLRGEPPDEAQRDSFDVRRIGNVFRVLVASPAYLQRRGTPQTPPDLARHDCIVVAGSDEAGHWTLQDAQAQPLRQAVNGRLRVADAELLRGAVLEDLGLALAPAWLFAAELRRGAVQAVLRQHAPPPRPIHAWVSVSRRGSERVQRVLSFLAGEFGIDPFLAGSGC